MNFSSTSFILLLLIVSSASADPRPPVTAEKVCASIDSDKYEAQCRTAIRDSTFDVKAMAVCYNIKTDYDKKSCMEVIKNKEYTSGNITDCLKQKKVSVTMCLHKNGVVKSVDSDSIPSPVPVTQ